MGRNQFRLHNGKRKKKRILGRVWACRMVFYRGPWKRSAKGRAFLASLPGRPSWQKARDSILFHVKHFCVRIFSKMGSRDMIWRAAGNVKFFFGVWLENVPRETFSKRKQLRPEDFSIKLHIFPMFHVKHRKNMRPHPKACTTRQPFSMRSARFVIPLPLSPAPLREPK